MHCKGSKIKKLSGFTLVELIIVIVILGILAVYAAPRFFSGNAVAESVVEVQLLSLLRLQQQRAMQDVVNPCYGVRVQGSQLRPFNCERAASAEQLLTLPESTGLTITSNVDGAASGFNFNSLGCPVSVNHAAVKEQCGTATIQFTIRGQNTQHVCIQGQGYIRQGSC